MVAVQARDELFSVGLASSEETLRSTEEILRGVKLMLFRCDAMFETCGASKGGLNV